MKYSTDVDQDKTARAFGYELHCSRKDSQNIAYAIKGMKTDKAKQYLTEIMNQKRALPAVFHNGKRAHQTGIGPGSFPKKAAKYVLKILENAENNAEYKGFDPDNMKIAHASAYGGRVLKGFMPRAHGRATDKNTRTTNFEIILEEVD